MKSPSSVSLAYYLLFPFPCNTVVDTERNIIFKMQRLSIIICLLLQWCFVHSFSTIPEQSSLSPVSRPHRNARWNAIHRGGGSSIVEDEEEEEGDDSELLDAEEEEEEADAAPSDDNEADEESETEGKDITEQAVQVAGKTTLGLFKASIRAFSVAFSPGSGDEGVSVLEQIAQRFTQFWKTLLSSAGDKEENEDVDDASTANDRRDFANYLATAYKVKATRNNSNDEESKTEYAAITGGSIQDALQLARSQSRLLLVLIPANRPDRQTAADKTAIESFLSSEVAKMAEKRAHKNIPTPSFLLWSAKAKSPEAVVAAKRLNMDLNPKRPVLLVATSKAASSSCQVLAQHHCNPPPNASIMAAWLNAIRKRHKKLYLKMHRAQKELQIAQERVEGYRTSIVQEQQRQIDLQTQKEQEEARAQAAAAHAAAIQQRRTEFAAALPDPAAGTMTLALRFADGTSHQRKFDPESATLETVFNWVDVVAEKEREKVVLTTMNGKQTFVWEKEHRNRTLREMGWGKMIAFRVTESAGEETVSPTV